MEARPSTRPAMADRTSVFVYAADPILEAGVAAQLAGCTSLRVVGRADPDAAEVAVVVVDEVDEDAARVVRALQRPDGPRVVVVATRLDDAGLLAAVEAGACALLRRGEATALALEGAVRAAAAGDGSVPGDLLARLLDQVGRLKRQVLDPRGIPLAGSPSARPRCCGWSPRGSRRRDRAPAELLGAHDQERDPRRHLAARPAQPLARRRLRAARGPDLSSRAVPSGQRGLRGGTPRVGRARARSQPLA